jgi:ABC-type dipeptide/oligopeptide/nickel transport system ATPase component
MIDLNSLPREIQDKIELREQMDSTFHRFVEEDYTEVFFNTVSERANPEVEHSLILSICGEQGVGKSMSAIAIAKVLNPNFDAVDIYFDYNQLVYNRDKLRYNSVVLVDEQQQSYGLDSHRVMTILASLKEQLRKKSIHFIFCSPVLYSEAKSSMYIIEVVFIDYENQEAYAALKTREELTLGHVRIPYPLKDLGNGQSLATPEMLKAYEDKKDAHLEKVLGNKDVDIFEERAQAVMKHKLFKKAERIYKKKRGYIPRTTLVQIINKIYPEFHAGVVPIEIAGRIKLDKEISGEWDIAGSTKKKKK